MEEHSAVVTRRLAVWSRATELQALAARGIHAHAEAAEKALGRGLQSNVVAARAICRRCDPGAQRVRGGYTDMARLWATIRAGLSRLRAARGRGSEATKCYATVNLIGIVAGVSAPFAAAWATVENAQDEAAARFATWRACAPGASDDDVDSAWELMKRLETAEVQRAARQATQKWHAWVA